MKDEEPTGLKCTESNKYVELIRDMYNLKNQCLGATV